MAAPTKSSSSRTERERWCSLLASPALQGEQRRGKVVVLKFASDDKIVAPSPPPAKAQAGIGKTVLPAHIAATEEELELAVANASTAVRDKLAWTRPGDPLRPVDATVNHLMRGDDFLQPIKKLQKKFMMDDRFNLDGVKIVPKDDLIAHVKSTLAKSDVFSSVAAPVVCSIAELCWELLLELRFAVPADAEHTSDLFNHELDQDKPGYSLNEICEVKTLLFL
jgi:hypothetical protein